MVLSIGRGHAWDPLTTDIIAVAQGKPQSVPEVLSRLTILKTLFDRLPGGGGNPSASFNDLYLRITARVLDYLHKDLFHDPAFLERLDVEFAARYLHAVELMATNGDVPKVWSVVFRAGPHVSSMAAAAAGVNAHVNFDLAFALLATLSDEREFPAAPKVGDGLAALPSAGSQYADYVMVNQIFHQEMPKLIKHFARRDKYLQWLYDVHGRDQARYRVEDELVIVTRGIAWDVCRDDLWPLEKDNQQQALNEQEHDIDARAAIIGKIILSPLSRLFFGSWRGKVRSHLPRPLSAG